MRKQKDPRKHNVQAKYEFIRNIEDQFNCEDRMAIKIKIIARAIVHATSPYGKILIYCRSVNVIY